MTGFEITFNIITLLITVGSVCYMRHLVKTSGSDLVEDPELARRFRETAPYHLLK